MQAFSCIEAIAVPQIVSILEIGRTTNKHKQLRHFRCSDAGPNYVKRLSFHAHTFDRENFKSLIVKGLMSVAEGRRNVPLVTCVTKGIARRAKPGAAIS